MRRRAIWLGRVAAAWDVIVWMAVGAFAFTVLESILAGCGS